MNCVQLKCSLQRIFIFVLAFVIIPWARDGTFSPPRKLPLCPLQFLLIPQRQLVLCFLSTQVCSVCPRVSQKWICPARASSGSGFSLSMCFFRESPMWSSTVDAFNCWALSIAWMLHSGPIHLPGDRHVGRAQVCLTWRTPLQMFPYKSLYTHMFSFLLGK